MLKFVKRCKKELTIFLITSCIWAGIGISFAYILKFITGIVINNIVTKTWYIVGLPLLYLCLNTLFEFAFNYAEALLRTKVSSHLRNAIMNRILRETIEEKEEKGGAYYLSLLNNSVMEIENEYMHGILMVIYQLFSLVFALVATMIINPTLSCIIVFLCILPAAVPKLLRRKLEQVNQSAMQSKVMYLNFLNDFMDGFLTIKVFGRLQEIKIFHSNLNVETTKKIQFSAKWKRLSMMLSYGISNIIVVGGWVFGVIFTLRGLVSFPELIALTTLMNMIAGPFQIISEYYARIVSGRAIVKDVIKFLDIPKKKEETGYKSLTPSICSIELKDVSVIKGELNILNNINLIINKGEKICLLGHSGSGKTSLLKSIMGITKIKNGHILLNGVCVEEKEGLIHPTFRFVSQNTTLFSTTIANNISLFKDLPKPTLEKALYESTLGKWYENIGKCLEININRNNVNLSGGELRRIDFARTLVEDAQALLFDEPTSGLDQFHAKKVMDSICSLKNCIVIVATHNLDVENVCRFDSVYILKEGLVVAHDTPKNILSNSYYLELKQGTLE